MTVELEMELAVQLKVAISPSNRGWVETGCSSITTRAETTWTISLSAALNQLSPGQKYPVKSISTISLNCRVLLTVISSVITTMLLSFTRGVSIPGWPRNQVTVGLGMELAIQLKVAMSPSVRGSIEIGCSSITARAEEE